MEMKKKGMFFTMTALLLLSLALLTIGTYNTITNRESIHTRIESMNEAIFSIQEDLNRKLFISGFRIIFLFEKRILEDGTYITNTTEQFNEAFFNGTIQGEVRANETALLQGVTYTDITQNIQETATKLNLKITLNNPQLKVYQENPWYITIQLTTDTTIQDLSNLANWNTTLTTKTNISIQNFEDPLYVINTNGLIFQQINKTPHTTFTNGSNIANLLDHVTNKYYKETNKSPNFLMKLEGNQNPNEYGIESLVYLPELSTQGITLQDKTITDNEYFSTNNPTAYNIQGMPGWFKIDQERLTDYGVEDLTV
jgi:hypothetical protein